jgi:Ca-activated chloride channel family protein
MFLDAIDVETISSGTTALDQAIVAALQAFKATGSRKNKLLVLFTDGEDFSSNLSGIKQQAVQEGLTIFALGVGTVQGAPIPLYDEQSRPAGHQLDSKGNVVISQLNEGILTTLANDCGGTYLQMTDDGSQLTTLVRQLDHFEKERWEDKKVSRFQEQYGYCCMVAFVCLLIEWML